MARAGMAFSSSLNTCRGCSQFSSSSMASFIISMLKSSISFVQSLSSSSQTAFSSAIRSKRSSRVMSLFNSRSSNRLVNAFAAAPASPQIPTDIFLTKPSIFWSASIWIIFASEGQ